MNCGFVGVTRVSPYKFFSGSCHWSWWACPTITEWWL